MQFIKLLQDVRSAFRDIFESNYFITSYMTKQLTTPWVRGTVPVMATMMALMNRRIVRIEPLDLFPELNLAYDLPDAKRPRMLMRGVRIEFAQTNVTATQQLYYVSLDATDKALEFYPEFVHWLAQNRPATVVMQEIRRGLEQQQFAKTRDMLLESVAVTDSRSGKLPGRSRLKKT